MSLTKQKKILKTVAYSIVLTFSLLYVSPVFTVNAQQFSKVTPEEIAEKALADFKVSDSEVDYSIVALESEQPKIGAYNVVEEKKSMQYG